MSPESMLLLSVTSNGYYLDDLCRLQPLCLILPTHLFSEEVGEIGQGHNTLPPALSNSTTLLLPLGTFPLEQNGPSKLLPIHEYLHLLSEYFVALDALKPC